MWSNQSPIRPVPAVLNRNRLLKSLNPRSVAAGLLLAALCGTAISCIGRDAPSIDSQDPDRLIPAIKAGVMSNNQQIIPKLVNDLESDDSAIRFYAIDGLQRLTGQDLGYVFFDDADDRKPAVQRWKEWLAEHPGNGRNTIYPSAQSTP